MAKSSLEQSRALFGFLKDLLCLRSKPFKAKATYASASFRVADQSPVITRVRGARDLYDIPPREIAMIIRGVMNSRPALSKADAKEDLFRQVLLLLDFTKLTKKADEYLSRILANYSGEILTK